MNRRWSGGFTAVELLIVALVIALLAAIAIPVLHNQLERARNAVDQANMHTAYTVLALALITGEAEMDRSYYFDPQSSSLLTVRPEGYGMSSSDAGEWWTGVGTADGVPHDSGVSGVLSVRMGEKEGAAFHWSIGSALTWKSLPAIILPVEKEENPFYWFDGGGTAEKVRRETYDRLLLVDSRKRSQSDGQILDAIADYFESLQPSEAKKILGLNGYRMARAGGSDLFRYSLEENRSIRLEISENTNNADYLKYIGYMPKIGGKPAEIRTEYALGAENANYVDTYLFTSDEAILVAGMTYEVRISFREEYGMLQDVKVWMAPVAKGR